MDYLDFDSKLLNIGARYLAKSLSHLLNLSLRQSYIPKEWKMAFVTPIYKRKGTTDDPTTDQFQFSLLLVNSLNSQIKNR